MVDPEVTLLMGDKALSVGGRTLFCADPADFPEDLRISLEVSSDLPLSKGLGSVPPRWKDWPPFEFWTDIPNRARPLGIDRKSSST